MLERSRSAKNDILKAGLIAASLLGAHDKLEAADIPPNATWEDGVTELRRSVMKEPVEYAAAAAAFHNGSTIWPRTLRGDIDGVLADYRNMIRELAEHARGEPIQNFCDIHTHSVASIRHEFGIRNAAGLAYAPPSAADAFVVTKGGRQETIPRFARAHGLQIQSVTAAVFDPRGVWYYRTLADGERQEYGTTDRPFTHVENEFSNKVHTPFTTSSVLPDFNFKVEYEKLRTAYRQMIGTEIRFVSYEDLTSEPPCAGPDYRPEGK